MSDYGYDDETSGRGGIAPIVVAVAAGVGILLLIRARRKKSKSVVERVKGKVNTKQALKAAKEARKAAAKAQKAMKKNRRVRELTESAKDMRDALREKVNRKEAARIVHKVGDAIAGASVNGATVGDVTAKAKNAVNGKRPSRARRLFSLIRR